MSNFIEIENLKKKYKLNNGNEINAVDNVNIEVEKGDIYGIIGLSGAGKSTLIRLINRLEEPTSGKIIVNYKDKRENVLEYNQDELNKFRKKTGMIFQHFNLFNSRNVAGNISFPMEISGWEKEKINKRVDELLEIVGLSSKKENYPEQLSGGQKQRVAIARALANNPEILLSDEATSALDPRTTNSILELLKDINKRFGITIILITHQMEVIRKICNKTAIMSDGKIVEKGTTKEIFLNPKTTLAKEFVSNINELLVNNPRFAELNVYTSIDDEGNGFIPIIMGPSPVQIHDPNSNWIEIVGYLGEKGVSEKDINGIIIN